MMMTIGLQMITLQLNLKRTRKRQNKHGRGKVCAVVVYRGMNRFSFNSLMDNETTNVVHIADLQRNILVKCKVAMTAKLATLV